jgi:hypothetical protein
MPKFFCKSTEFSLQASNFSLQANRSFLHCRLTLKYRNKVTVSEEFGSIFSLSPAQQVFFIRIPAKFCFSPAKDPSGSKVFTQRCLRKLSCCKGCISNVLAADTFPRVKKYFRPHSFYSSPTDSSLALEEESFLTVSISFSSSLCTY